MTESCCVFSLMQREGEFLSSLQGGCHKPLLLHLPVVLGLVQMTSGGVVRTSPRQGSMEGLVEVGWQQDLAFRCSRRPFFDGWPGSLCRTDHPAMTEVLKHVPVNSTLGSELKREQSPINGPWWQCRGGMIGCKALSLSPTSQYFQRQCAQNLSKKRPERGQGLSTKVLS